MRGLFRPIDDDETLATLDRLWALDRGLEAVSRVMHARIGVTGPQRFVLRMIGRDPGLTAGTLARRLHDHPSTLTAALKRLVEQRLVARREDPEDHRRVRLHLTAAGKRLDEIREGTVEAAVRGALAGMSAEEAEALRAGLAALAEALERTAGRE
ncbi:MAG: MarR family winged helix-turn-helix transcriptional regulator [Myxococcota bacterium]